MLYQHAAVRGAPFLGCSVMLLASSACGGGATTTAAARTANSNSNRPFSGPAPHVRYAVLTHRTGSPENTALFKGRLTVEWSRGSACAGLGNYAVRWPAGYTVEFYPERLVSRSGKVVAQAGDVVGAGGGGIRGMHATRCSQAGAPILILSHPQKIR